VSTIDRIPARRHRNRAAFLIGVASLIDLPGIATYEAMQDLMPDPPTLRPLSEILNEVTQSLTAPPSSK
jgi:hypothetical protein